MDQANRVLCVVSEVQRKEYDNEFGQLKQPGVELIFEHNPESAVSKIDQINPSLVILGMQIEDYEGIELMTMIMQQHKGFHRPIVILPDKEDGLAPMIHSRSLSTGQSSVESAGFDLIAELVQKPPHDPPVAAADGSPGKDVRPLKQLPEPEDVISPSQILAPALADLEGLESKVPKAVPQEPGQARSGKGKLIVAVVAVAVLVVIGLVVVLTGGEQGGETPGVAKAVVVNAPKESPKEPVAEPEPVAHNASAQPVEATEKGIAEPVNQNATAEPAETPEKAAPDPEVEAIQEAQTPEASAVEPDDLMLALTFDKGQGDPDVVRQAKLIKIVDALKTTPNSRIVLTGHTSSEGATVNNYDLGLKRAKRVRDMLIKMGIPKARFETRSLGEKKPLVENDSEQNRRKNRRVEVGIIP